MLLKMVEMIMKKPKINKIMIKKKKIRGQKLILSLNK